MNTPERISSSDDDLPYPMRRFFGILDQLNATKLKQMMDDHDIPLVFVPNFYILHRSGVDEECFYRMMADENKEENRAALVVIVNERLIDQPEVISETSKLVGELGTELVRLQERRLSLERIEDFSRIEELMTKNDIKVRL